MHGGPFGGLAKCISKLQKFLQKRLQKRLQCSSPREDNGRLKSFRLRIVFLFELEERIKGENPRIDKNIINESLINEMN